MEECGAAWLEPWLNAAPDGCGQEDNAKPEEVAEVNALDALESEENDVAVRVDHPRRQAPSPILKESLAGKLRQALASKGHARGRHCGTVPIDD